MGSTVGKFLAGPVGSALRVAVALVLGYYVAALGSGGELVPSASAVKTWVGAAIVIALPVVIAALNPQDPRFGRTGE
jgi:hypothetical protein